jgi:putative membrane protein
MMGFGFGGFGLILMTVFWVAIIALAVWVLGRIFPKVVGSSLSHSSEGRNDLSQSPQEILKQRYAHGEVSKAEFDEMRLDLLE